MSIFARLFRRRKPSPPETAAARVYGYAVRQIEARRCLGLRYPEQYPEHRHESDRYLGRAS